MNNCTVQGLIYADLFWRRSMKKSLGWCVGLLLVSALTQSACTSKSSKSTKDSKPKTMKKEEKMAPDTFKVKFLTTQGHFVVEATRSWSPLGVDRFHELVSSGFFKDIALFRVLEGFVVQFGIHGDPEVSKQWRGNQIQDDPVKESNKKGTLTFAMGGPNTRTTQFFVNLNDNTRLDSMGFSPIGKVIEGMDVVEKFYNKYGEGAPQGSGPDQGRIQSEGNIYLKKDFPHLDYIKSAELL